METLAGIGLLGVGFFNWVVVALAWLPRRTPVDLTAEEPPSASLSKRLSMSLVLAVLGGLFITGGLFLIV